ncbi:MAG: saccharopine dehydrogenase NADP-binding domain-containing protein [Deltaproteobacteria bacterium]|nr:saccharopine dehydrogenase NADP-binding domain-containing protein [Deltaproteobacteria bacterium]
MTNHAVILGGGMVGSAMAMDLARDPGLRVTVVDAREAALTRVRDKHGVAVRRCDLGDPSAVKSAVADADIVLGALSSVIGLQTLRAVIEAHKPYVDISFMADDALQYDALAREHGVTAVVDCGVAPGMSNLLAGYAALVLSPCEHLDIMVGGLPAERRWPYEYKAGFAPHDVIEEYVRPSRIVEGGKLVVKEALSEPELVEFAGLGTLEAFNTDGLRSLAFTLKVPHMRERTLRYPGHIALMRVLRETGFFAKEPITVKGAAVRPLDVTAALLFPKWTFEEGEADLTVMRVEAVGTKDGKRVRLRWDLFDRYDPQTGYRSMSRTTAFPATIVARRVLDGRITAKGVLPPEKLATVPGLVDDLMAQLGERGVRYHASSQVLDDAGDGSRA